MEPQRGFEPRASRLRGGRSGQLSYRGTWLGKQESNLHKRDRLLIQSQACCRVTPFPIGAGGGSRTRTSSCSPSFELGAAACYATPACAARDSNPVSPD